LRLPAPNPFIATELDLKHPDCEVKPVPEMIEDSPTTRLWYKQDIQFKRPKVSVACRLNNRIAYDV